MIDANVLLRSLIGETLTTVRGRSNTVLEVNEAAALVATSRSPNGHPVPISSIQAMLDRLAAGEEVPLEPPDIGYRSAFLGAVLQTLPMIDITTGTPPRARIDPTYVVHGTALGELEIRLGMYAALIEQGGPSRVAPSLLRELRIYGGASGVWSDVDRTQGVGDTHAVTVGLLHTGRHYPDDLSR